MGIYYGDIIGIMSIFNRRTNIINGHATGTDLLEVPAIYKAYFLGLCKGISPENMALYNTVPPF